MNNRAHMRWGPLVVALALAFGITACAGQTDPGTTTSLGPSTTVAPTTTNPSPTTSSTATTLPEGQPTEEDILAMASGSGCTPDDQIGLPDGEWFGYVVAANSTTLDFDLACWFGGEAADIATEFEGIEGGATNDYTVWNRNEVVRELPIGHEVIVHWYRSGDPNDDVEGTVAEWIADKEALAAEYEWMSVFDLGVWIDVHGGQVTAINEMWVP